MTIFEFEESLKNACDMVESCKELYLKRFLAKIMLSLCSNDFEEQCVVERLKECV